jgi:general secretion pathway protein L
MAGLWRWWTGELRQLVPARLSAIGGGTPVVALEMLDPLEPAAQRDALRRLLQEGGETRGRVRLRLARGETLVRKVWLPAATEENLEQVVGFEMDRLTPFRAEDVYYDQRVVARDPAAAQIHVELAVARREILDAKVERLRGLGANVQAVLISDDAGQPPLDLMPHEQRQRDAGRDRWLVPILAATVITLLALALLLPVYNKRAAVVALMPQVAQAKQQAEATDVIRVSLEKQVTDYNFLLGRKHGTWPALGIVEEVSKLLPDHTWVQQLDVKTIGKNREVQITGETPSSSKLIEIFEQSTILQNAGTKGAVTRGSMPGTERFMIVAEARTKPAPPVRPLAEVAAALPNVAPVAQPPAVTVPQAVAPPPGSAAPAPAAAPPTPAKVEVVQPSRAAPPSSGFGPNPPAKGR